MNDTLKPSEPGAASPGTGMALAAAAGVVFALALTLPRQVQSGETSAVQTVQVNLNTALPPPAAPQPEGPYRLGIGDVLDISVYGEEGAASQVPVDPSGHISYRLVGSIPAAGRTIDELRVDLQDRISKDLRHALVTIIPERFGSRTFSILGQVRVPGTFPIEGRMTVFDALARGGGLMSGQYRNSTVDLYDLPHAALLRHGKVVPVDFEALIQRGDATQNVPLESGDIINIPSALVRNIYVLGEVFYPRTVGMVASLTLVQALTEARGLKESASGKLVIVRGSVSHPQVTVVDSKRLLDGGIRDIQLAPGDIVYAPRRSFEIIDDIVKAALSGFAAGAAGEAAAGLYQKIHPDQTSTTPVVVP